MAKLRTQPHRKFSLTDSKATNGDGMVDVLVDVERRISLVIGALAKYPGKGIGEAGDLMRYLNTKHKNGVYNLNHITYVLGVLVKVGIVELHNRSWRLTSKGMARYKVLEIIKIN